MKINIDYEPKPEAEISKIVVTQAIEEKVIKNEQIIDGDPIKLQLEPPNKNGIFKFTSNQDLAVPDKIKEYLEKMRKNESSPESKNPQNSTRTL